MYEVEAKCQSTEDRKECDMCNWQYRNTPR